MALHAGAVAAEGLRLIKREPAAVGVWTLGYLVLLVVMFGVMFAFSGSFFGRMAAGQFTGAALDPAEMMTALKAVWLVYALYLPFGILVQAVLMGAIYRAVLRPYDRSAFFIRLGGDELRLFCASVILIFLTLAVMGVGIGVVLAVMLMIGGVGAVLFGILAWPALICLFIFIGVRLCLATPMTFAEQRLRIFGSWRLTKGHFWSLFGAAVLAFLLILAISLVAQVVLAVVGNVAGEGFKALMSSPTVDGLSAAAPFLAAYSVMMGIAGLLQVLVFLAPLPAAYRALVMDVDITAETFA